MPTTRNLRVRNAHSASYNPPQLPCAVDDCTRFFRSKTGLTRHIRASHPHHGASSRPSTPGPTAPGLSLHCTFLHCGHSFKSQRGLTQHMRKAHAYSVQSLSPGPAPAHSPSPGPAPAHSPSPSPAPAHSPGSTHLRTEPTTSPPGIFMPSPSLRHHIPSPFNSPSSPTFPIQDDDYPYPSNDMMDYDFNHSQDGYQNQMDEGHPFYQSDDGAAPGAPCEPRGNPPREGIKQLFHPIINGIYVFW
jgi:uncharacterized C2H2 Zn-finger protein